MTNDLRALCRVLEAKIALTVFAWCVPLLLLPTPWLEALGFVVPQPRIFLYLLGMAYTALVVGYAFGLRSAREGEYPEATVWVGLVSNGGACLMLAVAGFTGTWSTWEGFAPILMWGSMLGTGAITAGLIRFGPMRAAAE